MTKQYIHHDNQVLFARKVDASYRQIQSLMFTLEKQIEEQLEQYAYDKAIRSDLSHISDVSATCVQDIANTLLDASLERLKTNDEANESDYMDYMPDSYNDPDRNTYGEAR